MFLLYYAVLISKIAHQQMYLVLGFIHRDISLSNMYLIDKYPNHPSAAPTHPSSASGNIQNSSVLAGPGSPQDTQSTLSRISSSVTTNPISSFGSSAESRTPAAQAMQDVFDSDAVMRGMLADFDYVARVSDPSVMEKIDPKLKKLTPEEQRQRLRTVCDL